MSERYKIGHPLSVLVKKYVKRQIYDNLEVWEVEVEDAHNVKGIISYFNLFDGENPLEDNYLPPIGSSIDTVILNNNEELLDLSIKPSHLALERITQFKAFNQFMANTKLGTLITGKIRHTAPFGIFVELDNLPFLGLIDIGHSSFNGGPPLPLSQEEWPKEGTKIRCVISYFRPHDKQIGLGWMPEEDKM